MRSAWLMAGGVLSAVAAVLHLACIVGGSPWYRAFGAGERMVRLAGRGATEPIVITTLIAAMLALWAAYAFAGAGLIAPLPLLRPGLVAITAIYLARAAAAPWMLRHAVEPGRSATFVVVSSLVVLVFGVVHAVGLWTAWRDLR